MHRIQAARRLPGVALGSIAVAAVLALAACGSSPASAAKPKASPSMHHSTTHASAMALVGASCHMIPDSGMSSMHSMSMDPVVTAASHNPLLTTFAKEAAKAGLTADLNSMHSFTVFAPENSAFAKLPAAEMGAMHSKADLAAILKFHVVGASITPAQIARGITVTTLEGGKLKLSKMGAVYEVDNADIVCGNLHTENAIVYIINKVLTPMH